MSGATRSVRGGDGDGDRNAINKAATLPYQALQLIFYYIFAAADARRAAEALATVGMVCSHWRSILISTAEIWIGFIDSAWGRACAPQAEKNFMFFVERARRVRESLKPIKLRHTTPISSCEFTFRCPMVCDDLELVALPIPGISGPVFFCHVCAQNVYTVRNEEEKLRAAQEHRCVIFHERDTAVGAGVRIKVALVTEDDSDDSSSSSSSSSQPAVVQSAFCALRALADERGYPSSVSVRVKKGDVMTITMSMSVRTVTAEFQHVPRSQLFDKEKFAAAGAAAAASAAAAAATASSSSSSSPPPRSMAKYLNRPFIPDVVITMEPAKLLARASASAVGDAADGNPYTLDDAAAAALVAAHLSKTAFGMRISRSHICITAGNIEIPDIAPRVLRSLQDTHGDGTAIPLAFAFSPEQRRWLFGFEAVNSVVGSAHGPLMCLHLHAFQLLCGIDTPASLAAFLSRYPQMDVAAVRRLPAELQTGIFVNAPASTARGVWVDVAIECWSEGHLVATTTSAELVRTMFSAVRSLIRTEFFAFVRRSAGAPAAASTSSRSSAGEERDDAPDMALVIAVDATFAPQDTLRTVLRDLAKERRFNVLRLITDAVSALIVDPVSKLSDRGQVISCLTVHIGSSTARACVVGLEDGVFEVVAASLVHDYRSLGRSAASQQQQQICCCGSYFDDVLADYALTTPLSGGRPRRLSAAEEQGIRSSARRMQRLRIACERARKVLSFAPTAEIVVEGVLGDGDDLVVGLTRARLEMLVEPHVRGFVADVQALVTRTLQHSMYPPQLSVIVLCGGVAAMPLVTKLLREAFPASVAAVEQSSNNARQLVRAMSGSPLTDVAVGAAVQGTILCGRSAKLPKPLKDNWEPADGAQRVFSLVALAAQPEPNQGLMGMLDVVVLSQVVADARTGGVLPVIRRNSYYPTKKSLTISGASLFDTANGRKEVRFYEGERSRAEDNEFICALELPRPLASPDSTVTVTMDIDPNGILAVTAVENEDDGASKPIIPNCATMHPPPASRLSAADITLMVEQAERFRREDEELHAQVAAANRLEAMCAALRKTLRDPAVAARLRDGGKIEIEGGWSLDAERSAKVLAEVDAAVAVLAALQAGASRGGGGGGGARPPPAAPGTTATEIDALYDKLVALVSGMSPLAARAQIAVQEAAKRKEREGPRVDEVD